MNTFKTKKIIKKIINKYSILIFLKHIIRYCFIRDYRLNSSFIIIGPSFYYKYGKKCIVLLRPVINRYVKKVVQKNILISVNNIMAIGHIYPEIDLLIREINNNARLKNKIILYIAPKNKILIESKEIFERKNLKIIINGYENFIATLAAIHRPDISICVSQSGLNLIHGNKNTTVAEVFKVRQYSRAKKICKDRNYYPLRDYGEGKDNSLILSCLKVEKKYVLIQIKDKAVNGTLKPVNPLTYLKTINFLKSKNYDLIFVGREKMPASFKDLGVINYSESEFSNALNDYMLVFNAEMVISSASGYSLIAELLDIPLLTINSWQHVSYIGRKTVLIPTLLKINDRLMSFDEQYNFAFSDIKLNEYNVPISDYKIEPIDADSDDIYYAANELLNLIKNGWDMTDLQKKIKQINGCNMLGVGMSRIAHSIAAKNIDVFLN